MYWTLFITFVRIGAFTIGGGYAMLPLIQREVVDRGWMSKEEFIDLFAVAQSLPGVFAVNISIFVGYKLKKLTGSVICALGTILPSFLIILAIALFFTQFRENEWVEKAFKGLRPSCGRPDCRSCNYNSPFPPSARLGAGHSRGSCAIHMVAQLVACLYYYRSRGRRFILSDVFKKTLVCCFYNYFTPILKSAFLVLEADMRCFH